MALLLASLTVTSILMIQIIWLERKGLIIFSNNRRLKSIKFDIDKNLGNKQKLKRTRPSILMRVKEKLKFLNIDSKKFMRRAVGVLIILSYFTYLSTGRLVFIPATILGGCMIGSFLIDKSYRRKLQDFEVYMEEGIQNIISSLQAGLNLVQAFEVVGNGEIKMVSEVFKQILDEYNVGVSMQLAIRNTVKHVISKDLELFSQTIDIYYSSGGDITEVLESLLAMIRRRKSQQGDLTAKTAEVRMTAHLLIVLPVVLIIYLGVYQPEMITPLIDESIGRFALLVGVFLWGIGVFAVKKLTNVRTIE